MKKIITAINNPALNEELKKEKNFEVVGKDVQYKEAILEILEKNKLIDLIIISDTLLGEISIEKLIEKIKIINEKIKLIFILEKENYDLEKILIKNNINEIYFNDKINLEELITIINKNEINLEEEIIELKKIIAKKDEKNNFPKEKYTPIYRKNKKAKIITILGNPKSGRTTVSLIITEYLSKNKKVLLVDGDKAKRELSYILKKEKYISENKFFRIDNNFYFLNNLDEIKNIKKFYYDYIIIDLSKNNFIKIYKEIIKKSDIIFLIMEANLLNLKNVNNLLNIFLNIWKIKQNKINIIINKKNINSINSKLISNCLILKNKFYEIKKNKIYNDLIHDFFKIRFLLRSPKMKNNTKKILYKIESVKSRNL